MVLFGLIICGIILTILRLIFSKSNQLYIYEKDARKSIVYVIRLESNAAWEGASVSDVRIPTVPSVNIAVMLLPTEVKLPNLKSQQLTIPNVRVPRLLVLSCTVNASVRIWYAIPTASVLIARIPRRNQVPMEIVHVQGMTL